MQVRGQPFGRDVGGPVSPRGVQYNALRRQESRDQIAAAAAELFIAKGPTATTVSDVAARAGVSRGLLYNYFPNWDALIEHVVETHIRQVLDLLSDLPVDPDPCVRLDTYVRNQLADLEAQPATYRMWFQLFVDPQQRELLNRVILRLGPEVGAANHRLREMFGEIGWQDPLETTALFRASMQGVVFEYLVQHDFPDLGLRFRPDEETLVAYRRQLTALFGRPRTDPTPSLRR
jgi:AcrR family transcriptional regulator